MVKPLNYVGWVCCVWSQEKDSERGQEGGKVRMNQDSETSTEKQRTEVSRRAKIIIGISAFILVFTFVVIWWFSTYSPFPVTVYP